MSPRNKAPIGAARPGLLHRVGGVIATPWRALRAEESFAAIRRDLAALRSGGRPDPSRVRLDESESFHLDAMAVLQGKRRRTFEDTLATRQRSTSRNAWIFLGLGVLFFGAWLYRLVTMVWTAGATLTALQFAPACAVFFLLAFRFGLENYQIRLRRKVTIREFVCAPNDFWPR
jgi:hypothetical protein